MIKKLSKSIILLLALAICTSGSVASAAGHTLSFDFTSKSQTKNTDSYAKNDNEQNAYVTLKDSAGNDFIPGEDVFGCRIRRTSDDAFMTDYSLTNKFITYKLPYTKKGYKNKKYYLRGKIDSSGKYSILSVRGLWLP